MSESVYENLVYGPRPVDDLLEARLEAAAVIRDLSHQFQNNDASAEELRKIAALVAQSSEILRSAPQRSVPRPTPQIGRASDGGQSFKPPSELKPQDLFCDSIVSGSGHPMGMELRLSRDGDIALGHATMGPAFEGVPGRAHGGIVAAMVDETYVGLLMIIEAKAFTGELSVRFTGPCPIGEPVEFRAELVGEQGRKIFARCVGAGPDGVFAESDATFISVGPDVAPRVES